MAKIWYPVLHFPWTSTVKVRFSPFFTKWQAFNWWFPKVPKKYEKECSKDAVIIDGECLDISKICANKHQNDKTLTATTASLSATSIIWNSKMEDDTEVCRRRLTDGPTHWSDIVSNLQEDDWVFHPDHVAICRDRTFWANRGMAHCHKFTGMVPCAGSFPGLCHPKTNFSASEKGKFSFKEKKLFNYSFSHF